MKWDQVTKCNDLIPTFVSGVREWTIIRTDVLDRDVPNSKVIFAFNRYQNSICV
jgi:hypothetical protein